MTVEPGWVTVDAAGVAVRVVVKVETWDTVEVTVVRAGAALGADVVTVIVRGEAESTLVTSFSTVVVARGPAGAVTVTRPARRYVVRVWVAPFRKTVVVRILVTGGRRAPEAAAGRLEAPLAPSAAAEGTVIVVTSVFVLARVVVSRPAELPEPEPELAATAYPPASIPASTSASRAKRRPSEA